MHALSSTPPVDTQPKATSAQSTERALTPPKKYSTVVVSTTNSTDNNMYPSSGQHPHPHQHYHQQQQHPHPHQITFHDHARAGSNHMSGYHGSTPHHSPSPYYYHPNPHVDYASNSSGSGNEYQRAPSHVHHQQVEYRTMNYPYYPQQHPYYSTSPIPPPQHQSRIKSPTTNIPPTTITTSATYLKDRAVPSLQFYPREHNARSPTYTRQETSHHHYTTPYGPPSGVHTVSTQPQYYSTPYESYRNVPQQPLYYSHHDPTPQLPSPVRTSHPVHTSSSLPSHRYQPYAPTTSEKPSPARVSSQHGRLPIPSHTITNGDLSSSNNNGTSGLNLLSRAASISPPVVSSSVNSLGGKRSEVNSIVPKLEEETALDRLADMAILNGTVPADGGKVSRQPSHESTSIESSSVIIPAITNAPSISTHHHIPTEVVGERPTEKLPSVQALLAFSDYRISTPPTFSQHCDSHIYYFQPFGNMSRISSSQTEDRLLRMSLKEISTIDLILSIVKEENGDEIYITRITTFRQVQFKDLEACISNRLNAKNQEMDTPFLPTNIKSIKLKKNDTTFVELNEDLCSSHLFVMNDVLKVLVQ